MAPCWALAGGGAGPRYGPGVRRRLDPGLFLLLTPILWGATFPATKVALRDLSVPSFMVWARTLGFATVLAAWPFLRRRAPLDEGGLRPVLLPGAVLGGLMFAGYLLQTEGQARTTATNAAFITVIYVVLVPVLTAIVFRGRVPWASWAAVGISLVGLALLSITSFDTVEVHFGDLLLLAGAVCWAGHIVAIGRYSPRFSALGLSLAQLGFAAAFHLVLALSLTGLQAGTAFSADVFPLLVVTGILGTGVAFTIQVVAQAEVSATRAVVLLAGESIVAALVSAAWLHERLALHQWLGAALVLGAMVGSELHARRRAPIPIDPAAVP
jgi:drug/metabolite transporter (DMT)-like permease